MFVRTYAGAIVGIDAVAVTVEVNIAGGGLGMYLVGLPDNAVKESEQRIRAAFENSGERMSGRKVVVSLAPADLRKEGASFDLPIAVGILAAMGRVDAGALGGTMFAGELSLDGTLKPVRGVLPMAVRARDEGLRRLVLPADNAREAAVVEGIDVLGAGGDGAAERRGGDRARRARGGGAVRSRRGALRGGFRRREGAGARQAGAGDRCGGRAQRADDRRTGFGKDDAGAAYADDPAAAVARGGAGDDQDTLRGREGRGCRRTDGAQALQGSAPHHLAGGADRRRAVAAAGRGVAGAQRGAVSRRTARVRAQRAGGVATAVGREENNRVAGQIQRGIPGELYARGGDEPLSVRVLQP